jgi:site-specific recombinase XerD
VTSTDLVPARADEHDDKVAKLAAAFIATRRAAGTRHGYARDLTLWVGYCRRVGLDPLDVWPGNVQLWLRELADAGEAGTTQARRLASVSSWYGWLVRHQQAARNPAAALDSGERPVRSPRRTSALSDVDAGRLLDAADQDSPRAAALVWMLLYTGCRVGALIAADVSSIGLDRGYPVIDLPEKGGKTLRKTLVPPVFERLDTYLQQRTDIGDRLPALAAGSAPSRPLFATRTGRRIDRLTVRRLLKRLAAEAGLPAVVVDTLSPHTTRATYATSALDAGMPVRDVQYAMGHASPVTTEGYDRSALSPDREPGFGLLSRYRTGRASGGNE